MKKVVTIALFLALAFAGAQTPLRVLVLPFDANDTFEPYGLGLATGLQRTLNSLDGIYAPPVAEGGLFVTRANDAGIETPVDAATDAFAAHVVVSGAVRSGGAGLDLTLAFAGPNFPESIQVELQSGSTPSEAIEVISLEALAQLEREASPELIRSLAQEAPGLTSMSAVARASSRLGASLADLAAAAQQEPSSSWVLSEYGRSLALNGSDDEALEQAGRAVEANPNDAEAQAVLGIVANSAGDVGLARQAFEAALALNANHALALTGLAGLADDGESARALLEEAVASSPRLEEAVLGLAELEENHQRALQLLRRYSANLPESVALHRAFMQRALAAGDPGGALAYLEDVTDDPLAASPALYGLAGLVPEESSQRALELVREGRERFPESSGLQLSEAELLRRNGAPDEALPLLADLHERFPESAEVGNSYAVLLAEQGEVERAREVFTQVAGDSPTVQLNLARLLLRAGQARAALEVLEPLASENPPDAEVHTLHGVALGRTGRVDEAFAALDRALELDPESQEAGRARSILEQQSRITEGEGVSFEGEAATAFERGLYLLETGEPEEAASRFEEAYSLSQQPLAAFYQGYALQLAGQPRAALTPYDTAMEAFPNSDTVLNNVGYAQLQLGRFDLAIDTLRRAAEANEENPSVQVNLGLTYYGLERFEEALRYWDRAVELDPSLESDLADARERAQERREAQ